MSTSTFIASGSTKIGGRKRCEDFTLGKMEEKNTFLGVFDGHCGWGAAKYAYDNLWDNIKFSKGFGSDEPREIIRAITEGFARTQEKMLALSKKKGYRHLKVSGTTVACAIFRGDAMYVANVGDSAVFLGMVDPTNEVTAEIVTATHKPYIEREKKRIENLGGSVKLMTNNVWRVIWEPKFPEPWLPRRIPKLNMTRSLGDLWSFVDNKEYLISPVPDVCVHHIDPTKDKYIILATDGLLDVMEPKECIKLTHEMSQGCVVQNGDNAISITEKLIDTALAKWDRKNLTADNVSAIIAFIKPL